ncbi:MAG: hypothetical protein WCK59_04710 [Candidatus Falkowbacteria bacterium]
MKNVKEIFVMTGQTLFWSSAFFLLLLIDIVATIATYFHFKITSSSFIGLELLFSATIVLNIFLAIDTRKLLKEKTERKFISKWAYFIATIILVISLFLLNQN